MVKKLATVTVAVIWLTLICAIAVYIAIPWLPSLSVFSGFTYYVPTLICLYVGGAGAIWLVIEFLRIMTTVRRETPFVYRNVSSLKHIAVCCAICIAALTFIEFFNFSLTLLICIGILAFGLLCAMVLALLWEKAVTYKQENDLTV